MLLSKSCEYGLRAMLYLATLGDESEEEEGEGEGEGTPTSPGDRWLDAVVSDVSPPPDPDAEETEGTSDDADDPDSGFEFGSRAE